MGKAQAVVKCGLVVYAVRQLDHSYFSRCKSECPVGPPLKQLIFTLSVATIDSLHNEIFAQELEETNNIQFCARFVQ